MSKQRKVRRKYQVKNDAFVRYIVSALRTVPEEDIRTYLDEYERGVIRRPSQWVREASLPEIMVVCAKLGIKLTLIGMDERSPLQAFEIAKATKEFYRRKNVNALIELAAERKFFSTAGSIVMKSLGLYSQLLNGSLYVPNKDYGTFLQLGKGTEQKATELLEGVDAVLGATYILNEVNGLTNDDLAILYLVRRSDIAMPVASRVIYDVLQRARSYEKIRRHLSKLVKFKYLYKYGVKNNSMYSLTEKGWGVLNRARKMFFDDADLWKTYLPKTRINERSNTTNEGAAKAIA